jgi:hypothetical protein
MFKTGFLYPAVLILDFDLFCVPRVVELRCFQDGGLLLVLGGHGDLT